MVRILQWSFSDDFVDFKSTVYNFLQEKKKIKRFELNHFFE